jgi:gas vesicle protein
MAENDPNAKGYEPAPTPPYGGAAESAPLGTTTPGSATAYGSLSETPRAGESDVRDTLKDKARDVAEHARQTKDRIAGQAQEMAGEAKQQAKTMLDQQKGMAADALGGVADALRQTAQQLHDRDRGTMAQYAERAADQLDRFSRQLGEKDLGQMIRDAEDLGRRQPEVLIGGAVAAGFLLVRFLKASRRGRAAPPTTAYSTRIVATPEGFERTSVGTSGDISAESMIREGM